MNKKHSTKIKLFSIAVAAGLAMTAPAVIPQVAMAQGTTTELKTDGMYEIIRKINIYYKNDDGSVTQGNTLKQKGYVSNRDMKFTFKEVKVADLFGGNLGAWKADKDTIPSVTATYDNPPAEVDVYLTKDASKSAEESKTITRTIKYYNLDEKGNKTYSGSKSERVTFTRYGYIDSTGKKIMNEWSGTHTFKEVTVPVKSGYTANMAAVPVKTVTPKDSSFEVEVIYSKNPTKTEYKTIKRTIKFVEKKADGTTAYLGSATQSITLNREVSVTSGGKTSAIRDWSTGKIQTYTVPEKSGYVRQQTSVPSMDVNVNSKNAIVTVYYVKKSYSGVMNVDGTWKYYKNGSWDKEYTGVARTTNGNWVFVKNGIYDTSYTGVARSTTGNWVYVKKGRYYTGATGVARSTTGNYVYVKNGRYYTNYTGLARSLTTNRLVYVKNGRWQKNYNGIEKYDGKTYTVKNGVAR